MGIKQWWHKITGETSKVRVTAGTQPGGAGQGYALDSSRVDYILARALYENTDTRYKLGAGFCKRIINAKTGFMGVPQFLSADEAAQKTVQEFCERNTSKLEETHRQALLEGDCFVWVTHQEVKNKLYPETTSRLTYNIIPNTEVVRVNVDPVTKAATEFVLQSQHEWFEHGQRRTTTITQSITIDRRVVQLEGDALEGGLEAGEEPNRWGFIPIVHFKNEGSEARMYGQSELEPVEPFLKGYHDVMLHALQGSKMHSTPRLKFKLQDVAGFLEHNFNVTDPDKFAQEGGVISLDGHEFFLLNSEEEASFIEVGSSTGDAAALLKLLFYCIIDVSETPEFVFGVHTPGALASVKEQMPVFARTIARKRRAFEDSWQKLARIVLAMTAQASGSSYTTYATTLEWDEVDPRDGKETAEILKTVTEGLNVALQGGFISQAAAAGHLKHHVPTMKEYESDDPKLPGERERIHETALARVRLEDGALLADEHKELG